MYVLGLSFFYHDAAACLLKDGEVIAAAEEERFTRRKHDASFPHQAIQYCLSVARISISDVDYIGFYEKPFVKFDRILETVLSTWPFSLATWLRAVPVWMQSKIRVGTIIQDELKIDRDILFSEHHLSHAASAFYPSGFEEAAVLTMDGVGEWTTTAMGRGHGLDLAFDREMRFPHSIGLLYSALTAYLGFKVNDAEWKVMGLAPYGRPRHIKAMEQLVRFHDDGSFHLNMDFFAHHFSTRRSYSRRLERLFGRAARTPESELDEFHFDIARSVQELVERLVVHVAKAAFAAYQTPRLCLAGGVALNCVANWKVREQTGFKDVFIQPAANDSGGAIGSALLIEHLLLRRPRRWTMRHAALGPEFSDEDVSAALTRHGLTGTRLSEDELLTAIAEDIQQGAVVGWFQGRMEFGPRALGCRSILADPRSTATRDVINSKVKFREWFRPFAPAVLKEHAHEYFEMPAGLDLPFMLMVPRVRSDAASKIPAVTHQDGTGRVQTLCERDNNRFYRLVRRFGELTGVPVLVNTSFNVRGEPIVCSPDDACRTFLNTGIDVLAIGSFRVTEKPLAVDYAAGLQRSVALESGD